MKQILLFLFTASLFLTSCNTTNKFSIQSLSTDYPLVHIVFFKLKNASDADQLILDIKKTSGIKEVKNLETGIFKDLGDKRAMSEFQVFMQMRFANEAAYTIYQQHPIHLELKTKAKALLAGPPVTYDYLLK